ncbi:unnamed protein product [Amoebophrya sp. A120]|nr:unnamed protein product [Amoebophrya sp. A120]|eukprot:GSA120T00003601001.1
MEAKVEVELEHHHHGEKAKGGPLDIEAEELAWILGDDQERPVEAIAEELVGSQSTIFQPAGGDDENENNGGKTPPASAARVFRKDQFLKLAHHWKWLEKRLGTADELPFEKKPKLTANSVLRELLKRIPLERKNPHGLPAVFSYDFCCRRVKRTKLPFFVVGNEIKTLPEKENNTTITGSSGYKQSEHGPESRTTQEDILSNINFWNRMFEKNTNRFDFPEKTERLLTAIGNFGNKVDMDVLSSGRGFRHKVEQKNGNVNAAQELSAEDSSSSQVKVSAPTVVNMWSKNEIVRHRLFLRTTAPSIYEKRLRIVVTISTVPTRLEQVKPALISWLRQTYPIDQLYLFLPTRFGRDAVRYRIPDWLHELQEEHKQVLVHFCQEFFAATAVLCVTDKEQDPQTKILHAMDDSIVHPWLVERMLRVSLLHPQASGAVVTTYAVHQYYHPYWYGCVAGYYCLHERRHLDHRLFDVDGLLPFRAKGVVVDGGSASGASSAAGERTSNAAKKESHSVERTATQLWKNQAAVIRGCKANGDDALVQSFLRANAVPYVELHTELEAELNEIETAVIAKLQHSVFEDHITNSEWFKTRNTQQKLGHNYNKELLQEDEPPRPMESQVLSFQKAKPGQMNLQLDFARRPDSGGEGGQSLQDLNNKKLQRSRRLCMQQDESSYYGEKIAAEKVPPNYFCVLHCWQALGISDALVRGGAEDQGNIKGMIKLPAPFPGDVFVGRPPEDRVWPELDMHARQQEQDGVMEWVVDVGTSEVINKAASFSPATLPIKGGAERMGRFLSSLKLLDDEFARTYRFGMAFHERHRDRLYPNVVRLVLLVDGCHSRFTPSLLDFLTSQETRGPHLVYIRFCDTTPPEEEEMLMGVLEGSSGGTTTTQQVISKDVAPEQMKVEVRNRLAKIAAAVHDVIDEGENRFIGQMQYRKAYLPTNMELLRFESWYATGAETRRLRPWLQQDWRENYSVWTTDTETTSEGGQDEDLPEEKKRHKNRTTSVLFDTPIQLIRAISMREAMQVVLQLETTFNTVIAAWVHHRTPKDEPATGESADNGESSEGQNLLSARTFWKDLAADPDCDLGYGSRPCKVKTTSAGGSTRSRRKNEKQVKQDRRYFPANLVFGKRRYWRTLLEKEYPFSPSQEEDTWWDEMLQH